MQPRQSREFNPRFRNRNKPWAGRERLERRRPQANRECWPGFGLLLVRKTGILGCNIKIPSFQASFGAEEGFNPQPYSQTVSKIHFPPRVSLCRAIPAAPQKQHKTGFSGFFPVFNIPGHAALLPQPARVPGACSPAGRAWDLWHKHLQVVLQGMLSFGSLPGRHKKILGIRLLPSQGIFHKGISDFQPRFQICSFFPDFISAVFPPGVRSD